MDLYLMLGGLGLIAILATAVFILPVFYIYFHIKTANNKVQEIKNSATESSAAELLRYPIIAKEPHLDSFWSEYLLAIKKAQVPADVNIIDYFNYKKIIESKLTLLFADIMPVFLSVMGTLASIFLFISETNTVEDINLLNLYPAAAGIVLGLLFLLLHRFACVACEKAILTFTGAVNGLIQDRTISNVSLLSEILQAIKAQNTSQTEHYEKVTQIISEEFAQSVAPVLKDIEEKIHMFISAATERQIESMHNLAEVFVTSVNSSYADQFSKLENIIAQQVQVQEMSASSFENMRDITTASAENLIKIQQSAEMLLARFSSYLEKLGSMSDAVTDNFTSFTNIADYMRENAKTQTETIHNLSEYQKELAQVSGMYTSTMEKVVSDIKDQFISAMISLRSVSTDLLKSGNHLRDAYGDFTSSVVSDIEKIFAQFDDNLSGISAHLAKSIGDLQDAVDELPSILKAIHVADTKEEGQ